MIGWATVVCHPERSEGSLRFRYERFFASLRMTLLLMLGCSHLAAQQTNAERIISGRDTPSHDFDLIHQRIEVRNFDRRYGPRASPAPRR